MVDSFPHDTAVALKVAVSAGVSLATMMADFAWLIRDEVKYVWLRLGASWIAWVYVIARYLGIASQIYNVYFTVRMYLGVSTSSRGCYFWFIYQAVVIQFLLFFVEALLMHRLYNLFLRNKLILLILILFGLSQMVSMWVSAHLSFPSNKHTVTCLMAKANPGNAFFSATTLTTNTILFFMTSWRYLQLPVAWTRQGIGRVVFFDSAASFTAITLIMLFLMLSSLDVIKSSMSGNITYYWLVCVLWVSVGRIIVDHEKIPRDEDNQGEGSTWQGTLQLTSQIEMGQSTLSVDTQSGSSDRHSPASRTLQESISTPMTKLSQLSPSSPSTSEGQQKWLGDPPPFGHGHQLSPQPSSTELTLGPSVRRLSRPRPNGDDIPQAKDMPQADKGPDERAHSPALGPPPSSEPPPPSES